MIIASKDKYTLPMEIKPKYYMDITQSFFKEIHHQLIKADTRKHQEETTQNNSSGRQHRPKQRISMQMIY
jgi:hypothetical protein